MGVLPLQFTDGQTRASLKLTGDDAYTIHGLADLKPGQDVEVEVARATGERFVFAAKCRIDTANEMEYYRHGGILQFVLRNLAA
jgi:aconitate hydratase